MNDIHTTSDHGVLRITFNRPHKKNALTEEMYAELTRVLHSAATAPSVQAIVFSGEGGAFTAGNDLDDFLQRPPLTQDAPVFKFLVELATCEKPLLAAVEGIAIGIGTTMLLHCDLVYVAEQCKFAVPFATLGLTPEGGSSLLFPLAVGHQRAVEKLWFGDSFNAQEAFEFGFVNKILPAGQSLAYALAQAKRLAALPRGSVHGTKALLRGRLRDSTGNLTEKDALLKQMRAEAALFAGRLQAPAVQEAIAAFKARRAPDFSGMD